MVILQNAYGVEDGYVPSYERESFRNCHTGRRLKNAIPADVSVSIINASPVVGDTADSNFKPDLEYVRKHLTRIKPCVILACGVNAKKVVDMLDTDIPIIKMPHPAYRALTNKKLEEVKQQIEEVVNG
jgi:hypothetical protein